jgi:integrase/recombinase XerD
VPTDERLIDLWLHGRPATTQRVYRTDTRRLLRHANKPLRTVNLSDLQGFADALDALTLPRNGERESMFSSGPPRTLRG